MKTGASLVLATLLAALCGSSVHANGVCYDPDHVTGKNADSVAKDIATIKSKGFTYVRTYISKFGNTKMVEQLAASGLKVAAGVPYGQGDYAEQLEAAVAAVKNANGNIIYLFLGNENLAGAGSVPPALIQAIRDVKARVPGVKVGTVQRNTEFLNKIGGLAELVAACDVIGVNIHPFFTGGNDGATNAIETTKSHWNKIIGSGIPGIADKLVLGETGWPSAGSILGNSGSPASASAYFGAYKAWSAALPADRKFYFQMFDQPYKPETFEKTYGLLSFDSQDKFGASVPATTVAPTAAPTTTPAPTTAAPTATPKPAANNATVASSSSSSSDKEAGASQSSATGSLSDSGVEDLSKTESTEQETGAEAEATVDPTVRSSVDTPHINAAGDSTQYAGGSTNEANTQSSSSGGGGGAAVAFAVAAGCVAVLGAFGFIYRTRKKAQELEDAEGKMSFAVTPHGGCVL